MDDQSADASDRPWLVRFVGRPLGNLYVPMAFEAAAANRLPVAGKRRTAGPMRSHATLLY
jgi:hypothetical protein